jgi:hypothetical protein
MMRNNVALVLLLAVAFLLPPMLPAAPADAPAAEKLWTFMVYLSADNNLEPAGIHDFNEMETVGSTDDINIIVQFDRSPGYDSSNGNWTGARRYLVTKDNDMNIISSKMLADLGDTNMGDPQTFVNFTTWAADHYPAKHYFVDFWDHGGGWYGACWDDTSHDYLDLANISGCLNALKNHLGRPVDGVGYDACLMAGIEILYQMRGTCDVAVTSGTTEPDEGWPYDWIMPALAMKPTMTPSELATEITNDYVNSYTDGQPDPKDTVLATMSAWDMEKVQPLFDMWNQLSMRLAMKALTFNAYIREVRSLTQGYDPGHVVFLDISNYPLYDIYDFCNQFLKPLGGPFVGLVLDASLKHDLLGVQNALLAARIAERHGPRYPDGHGLTAYFPSGNESALAGTPKTQYDARYDNIDFAHDNYWPGFLKAYFALTNVQNTPPYVTIDEPSAQTPLSADSVQLKVTGTAFDTVSVTSVEVRIDNGAWKKAEGTLSWLYKWNIGSLKGTHTVWARASDGTYDSPVVGRTFTITPSTRAAGAGQGFAWLAGSTIVVLLLAAAGAFVAWKKGYFTKKRAPKKHDDG